MKKYINNKAQCLRCGSVIESKHEHDFVTCLCFDNGTGIFIDGGLDCPRRGCANIDDFRDLSDFIEVEDPIEVPIHNQESVEKKLKGNTIEIQLEDVIPVPWQSPRLSSCGAYNTRASYVRYIRILLKQKYNGPVLEGPIRCEMTFYMPIPDSESEKKRNLMDAGKIFHTKKPDVTNLMKLHEDCLQGIILANDSQVYESHIKKYYSKKPGITIRIEEVEIA